MIARLLMWFGLRVMPVGYVAVSNDRLVEYVQAEIELAMFQRHLSHRWQVRIRNRDAQERALNSLMALGMAEGDEGAFAFSESIP